MAIIEIEGLRKEYRGKRGRTTAIGGLDLSVPEGGVFGFLGPNGSGKTTTIRCLLGLVRPTAGRCVVLGADAQGDLHRVIGRIGSIVEAPALFPTLSGRKNLTLLASVDGIGPKAVTGVLERVGLGARGDDLVKGYSLGMRQRLAIGAALLKDPVLVVLDEPANGLDPAGIREIRELIRGLAADRGLAVFVSSHLLAEIELIADRVAIIHKGKILRSGPVSELISSQRMMEIKVCDVARAAAILSGEGVELTTSDDLIFAAIDEPAAPPLIAALTQGGVDVFHARRRVQSLEEMFLEATGGETVD